MIFFPLLLIWARLCLSSDILITDFSKLQQNNLGFWQSDDGSLEVYEKLDPSGARFQYSSGSYWYTLLTGGNGCFNGEGLSVRIIASGFKSQSGILTFYTQPGMTTKCSDGDGDKVRSKSFPASSFIVDPDDPSREVLDFELSSLNTDLKNLITFSLTLQPAYKNFSIFSISVHSSNSSIGHQSSKPPIPSTNLPFTIPTTEKSEFSTVSVTSTIYGGTSPSESTLLVAVISSIGGIVAISIVAVLAIQHKRKRLRKSTRSTDPKAEYNKAPPPGFINNNHMIQDLKTRASVTSDFSSSASEATRTLESNSDVIAIPGYLAIDINSDIDFVNGAMENLGAGGTAFIVKGKLKSKTLALKHGTTDVAIKIIKDGDQRPGKASAIRQSFLYEVTIMSALPYSPNIVQIIGYSNEPMAIVMKHYPFSLRDLIKRPDFVNSSLVTMKIAHDIACGLNSIHQRGILHLDVKPHNVLIDIEKDLNFNCVICDFGFANFVGEDRPVAIGVEKPTSIGISTRYAAPELFLMTGNKHNTRLNLESHKKIDVYAYAITVYEIATKSDAWQGMGVDEIQEAVLHDQHPTFPSNYDEIFINAPSFKSLICECWAYNLNLRPEFKEIENRINRIAGDLTLPKEVTNSLLDSSKDL